MGNEKGYVQGIINGERWAFKAIFLEHYEPLCNFCWRYTRSRAVSEDLVQEVFADLWDLKETLDPDKSLKVYLYQAVKNKGYDYVAHQKVVRKYQADQRHDQKEEVHQKMITQEDKAFIKAARQAIDALPPRAQQTYVLHRQDGLTYREIAEVMDVTVKTVESQMSRALDMLRSRLRNNSPDQVTERTIAKIFSIRDTGTE
ncbi:RNA polymerase sigma-70 factor, ECF subfamily [Fodinibius roseus]|uniref:RNA polymerase sigma-70 factor, ECF subfamily n=1 Tax=Fodinibius roseus TaxID=1194090 RepID=A0A1M4ULZ8_9BACT|nr:RNA polymerase sigma-70 factor [Fodinibius roseus]SHE57812.1 RNA polymerase sigma-70 factor, ECF subfamily [Fodinibius roseus]